MHRKTSILLIKGILFTISFYWLLGCTSDNPQPTGLFSASFSGNFIKAIEGNARFRLEPSGGTGILFIHLRESNNTFIRFTFLNPSPSEIFLEPGSYTIVPQLGNDLRSEVLVDYVENGLTFTANSGEIQIGVSKPAQISGKIVSAEFSNLRSMCNGTFDAMPE